MAAAHPDESRARWTARGGRPDAARGGARELALLATLGEYPDDARRGASKELAPHQIAFYLRELAGEFHSYYNAERILVPEAAVRLRAARAFGGGQAGDCANGLALIGVSAPEKM